MAEPQRRLMTVEEFFALRDVYEGVPLEEPS